MKIFKLLIVSIMVSCFFITTNLNAQNGATVVKDEIITVFNNWCTGDIRLGEVMFHSVTNKNTYNYSFKGEVTSVFTGETFKVLSNTKWDLTWPWHDVYKIKFIGKKGVVSSYHHVYNDGYKWWLKCDD